jgi:hypothetical protein
MDAIDYRMEAGLYYAKSVKAKQKSLVFRHFPKAADAIRYAVEELSPWGLRSCSLEHYPSMAIQYRIQ